MAENIMDAEAIRNSNLLPHDFPSTHPVNSTAGTYSFHGHLGGAGIAGIILLGVAIIFWVLFLCACFHVRCLLKEENEEDKQATVEV